ncbi:hypothetical protein NSP_48260 [Nodularia spumigena CCY9414]|nr:hypothetical protein NSP_48260 [Nodularia spumigena CCY9414]
MSYFVKVLIKLPLIEMNLALAVSVDSNNCSHILISHLSD